MDAVSPSRVRIVLLAIIAVAVAAVWMILAELFSPSAAHADATRSGLGTAANLRARLSDAVGVTPTAYRHRFSRAG